MILRSQIFLMIVMIFSLARPALALRCGNELVVKGDRKIEVLKKCGQPDQIEKWREERTIYIDEEDNISTRFIQKDVEEWTYNFGPSKFLYFLIFHNNKLIKIITGSRGFAGDIPDDTDKTRCGHMVARGDRKIEVLKKCGEPYFIDSRTETRKKGIFGKKNKILEDRQKSVDIEEWTYNFGANHFLFFIILENGKVVKTEFGDYGF